MWPLPRGSQLVLQLPHIVLGEMVLRYAEITRSSNRALESVIPWRISLQWSLLTFFDSSKTSISPASTSFYPMVFPVYPISVPSQGPQPPGSSCNPSRPFHVTAFAAFSVSAALGVDAALELRRELRAEALRGSAVAEVVRGCMAHAAGGWWLGGKAWVVVWFCKVGYIIWLVEWLWLLNYCYNYLYIYIYLARC